MKSSSSIGRNMFPYLMPLLDDFKDAGDKRLIELEKEEEHEGEDTTGR